MLFESLESIAASCPHAAEQGLNYSQSINQSLAGILRFPFTQEVIYIRMSGPYADVVEATVFGNGRIELFIQGVGAIII